MNNITGIDGLMGRTFDKLKEPIPKQWYKSTVYPGWMWQGNTSSDSATGHMFVYPIVYNLLAETPQEKKRALRLIDNFLTYVINNDYFLIDANGQRTQWGVWNPTYLNDNIFWYDERGLNALQIVSWILSAYSLTQDPKYLNAYNNLTNNYQYNINIINQKITQPSDDNYSDDELAW